jgi:hypothetical protein
MVPTISDTTAVNSLVAQVTVTMSDGSAFVGTPTLNDPDNVFSLVAVTGAGVPTWDILVAKSLVGLVPTGQTQVTDIVSVSATQ